ncbi:MULTISPECIES: DUF3833 domain-containing protein [unclassified Janthinobacterium]|uniref:DUF3833 domain-containing protein n=1 Tax=unclassified Janthinobacterium TaxID=2610881 RepID=UPI000349BFA7|nr:MULTISPECIES: DUF3833 domain-containing protein [unclassified Janthinobacterium]MEC5160988.1 hypothetical protein [Janthinobacterium sp. CG_S6]
MTLKTSTKPAGTTLKKLAGALHTAALALLLTACSTPVGPEHYAAEAPLLDVQRYFNGTLDAHGMFQDRSGTLVKRFTVVMRCHWEGDVGTLDEDFSYADGSKQKRVWTLRKTAPGRFVGTAPDVVGEAVGVVSGNALRWKYVLALPLDGKVYNVDFEDWMFLIDERVMLNRAAMSKFGFGLGAVTLSFDKRPPAPVGTPP